MSDEISKMESDMKIFQKIDSSAVIDLLSAYQNFAARYADDSLSPEYLYKAAGLATGFSRGNQAVEIYESIIHTYPSYRKIPECYFMEAFTYENVIGDNAKAYEYYNEFLNKYPQHDLADDARAAIKFLGKSPDELVREFEKMRNPDSVTAVSK